MGPFCYNESMKKAVVFTYSSGIFFLLALALFLFGEGEVMMIGALTCAILFVIFFTISLLSFYGEFKDED